MTFTENLVERLQKFKDSRGNGTVGGSNASSKMLPSEGSSETRRQTFLIQRKTSAAATATSNEEKRKSVVR